MIGNVVALVLAIVNMFVHSRDAWTSVVPTGLILSAATVVILHGHRLARLARSFTATAWELPDDVEHSPPGCARASARRRRALRRAAPCWRSSAGARTRTAFDPDSQIGPNPVLPEPQQYLFPPMQIADAVGWSKGETPAVPSDLKIQALATGLMSTRVVYTLPNGDILVAESTGPNLEPVTRPKNLVMGWIMSFAHAGVQGGNRITLLRDADGDGVPEIRTVFLDHLNSPFGVALVGQRSLCRQHRCDRALSLHDRAPPTSTRRAKR